jgi:hypothetical protein
MVVSAVVDVAMMQAPSTPISVLLCQKRGGADIRDLRQQPREARCRRAVAVEYGIAGADGLSHRCPFCPHGSGWGARGARTKAVLLDAPIRSRGEFNTPTLLLGLMPQMKG